MVLTHSAKSSLVSSRSADGQGRPQACMHLQPHDLPELTLKVVSSQVCLQWAAVLGSFSAALFPMVSL